MRDRSGYLEQIIMSLLLLALNVVILFFLIWLGWSRISEPTDRKIWLGYVLLKGVAACGFVWVYGYHYGTGDMLNYINDARLYRTLELSQFITGIFSSAAPVEIIDQLVYDFDRRAMLMSKMVALAYYLSGNIWITAFNFSLVSALVIFRFYQVLKNAFGTIAYPAIGAFLIFPSLLFWSSGICKEAISFPAMLLVLIPLLRLSVFNGKVPWFEWVLALFSALMLWLLKYYVAAIVLPACLLYGLSTLVDWPPYRKLIIGVAAYVGLLLMVSQLHPNLYLHRTMEVMVGNYELTISQTQPGKAALYEGLTPDVLSFAYHFPEAVFTGLFLPLMGQQWDLPSFLVVLQNSVLLMALIIVLVLLTVKGQWKVVSPGFWPLVGLILLLSGLLAITTPNYGTLDRYRVAYQPFMLLLVLSGIQQLVLPRKTP